MFSRIPDVDVELSSLLFSDDDWDNIRVSVSVSFDLIELQRSVDISVSAMELISPHDAELST